MKFFLFLNIVFFYTNINAFNTLEGKFGSDSIKCVKNISLYREYIKQKNFDDALTHWRKAYKICPNATKNTFIDGAKLYKYLINKNKENIELQKLYLDSLETLYDNRIVYFGKETYVLGFSFLGNIVEPFKFWVAK